MPECPATKFPDGTHCGEYGWHAKDCPTWVPDPEYDRRMEAANPEWCLEHDRWMTECGGWHEHGPV